MPYAKDIHSRIILPSMEKILARFRSEYGFIDTKFNIADDEDFSAENSFRGRSHVYNWIQGRGIESLAKHAAYFRNIDGNLADAILEMLATVVNSTEKCRKINGGRLPFVMSPDGTAMSEIYPEANYTDLFYGKGLFAAAKALNLPETADEAAGIYAAAVNKIAQQKFRTDQKSFDPKNPVEYVPGKHPQGPRMIALSGLADFAAAGNDKAPWLDIAAQFISFIYEYHVNLGQLEGDLQLHDFVETIDDSKKPRPDGEWLLCDPGHALEFVGLAGKCLLTMKQQNSHGALLEQSSKILPELFRHVFDYGFQPGPGGIVKTYDLLTRRATNTDMPWWNLPETIRAGVEMQKLFPENAAGIEDRVQAAWDAFSVKFLQKNGFACQTRDSSGNIVNVIPALPDADPGYHTNLSLIDAITL